MHGFHRRSSWPLFQPYLILILAFVGCDGVWVDPGLCEGPACVDQGPVSSAAPSDGATPCREEDCPSDVDPCEGRACGFGACVNTDAGIECACEPGWSGPACDTKVDLCAAISCGFGTCTSEGDQPACDCDAGWEGPACDVPVDPCVALPCANGECVASAAVVMCACEPGWAGAACDVDIDECAVGPCANGTCEDALDGYSCSCDAGWTGDHCDVDIDECADTPCLHGVCEDLVADFLCLCQPGWEGVSCDVQTFCGGLPCVHGGCKDGPDKGYCACDTGWKGASCATPVDACDIGPCLHGYCADAGESFLCVCESGWGGSLCDVPKDACESVDCAADAICVDGVCVNVCQGAPSGCAAQSVVIFSAKLSWPGGFVGQLDIHNGSDGTIEGWQLLCETSFVVTDAWNTLWSVEGAVITFEPVPTTEVIGPGEFVSLGVSGEAALEGASLVTCSLNGVEVDTKVVAPDE